MNKIGIFANLNKKKVVPVAEEIIRFFEAHKIEVFLELSLAEKMNRKDMGLKADLLAKESNLVITLGGDGTFLRAGRLTHKYSKPILGVNLGELGFLAEATLDSLQQDLKSLVNGKYDISSRMTLEGEILRKDKKEAIVVEPALNDAVIGKRALSRIIDLETYIDDEYITTYCADGIIVATPTGSTAYTLSAGGPIVYPGSQVLLVVPICPHMLNHRPLVVPASSKIKIKLGKGAKDVLLTVDGQVGLDLQPEDSIVIGRGAQDISLINFADTSYFDVLKRKMHWGKRIDSQAR